MGSRAKRLKCERFIKELAGKERVRVFGGVLQ